MLVLRRDAFDFLKKKLKKNIGGGQGNKLNNCLEDKYESQVKYVMRARQR